MKQQNNIAGMTNGAGQEPIPALPRLRSFIGKCTYERTPCGRKMRSCARGTKAALPEVFERKGVRSALLFFHFQR